MRLHFDALECGSVFDAATVGATAREIVVGTGRRRAAIRVVEVRDLLYLPNVLDQGQSVCLLGERLVPEEAILDCFGVEFLRQARQARPESERRYADAFEVDVGRDRVCILGNLFSRNFGHWTEEILKVALLEHAGEYCRYAIPTLPAFAVESLLLLGIDASRILSIDRPTRFDRAVFTTAISHGNLADYPEALFVLRDLVDRRLGAGSSRFGARLWLERGEMLRSGGVVLNRDEVYRCIEKHGFEAVDMATLPVADQLRAARGATAIAGPHGAQFVHAQFMPESSVVIECFSPAHVNPSILQICRVLEHSYHQIVARSHLLAPYAHGRDCVIDCEHLELVLDFH